MREMIVPSWTPTPPEENITTDVPQTPLNPEIMYIIFVAVTGLAV